MFMRMSQEKPHAPVPIPMGFLQEATLFMTIWQGSCKEPLEAKA